MFKVICIFIYVVLSVLFFCSLANWGGGTENIYLKARVVEKLGLYPNAGEVVVQFFDNGKTGNYTSVVSITRNLWSEVSPGHVFLLKGTKKNNNAIVKPLFSDWMYEYLDMIIVMFVIFTVFMFFYGVAENGAFDG